jgi:hypothetical protein
MISTSADRPTSRPGVFAGCRLRLTSICVPASPLQHIGRDAAHDPESAGSAKHPARCGPAIGVPVWAHPPRRWGRRHRDRNRRSGPPPAASGCRAGRWQLPSSPVTCHDAREGRGDAGAESCAPADAGLPLADSGAGCGAARHGPWPPCGRVPPPRC